MWWYNNEGDAFGCRGGLFVLNTLCAVVRHKVLGVQRRRASPHRVRSAVGASEGNMTISCLSRVFILRAASLIARRRLWPSLSYGRSP